MNLPNKLTLTRLVLVPVFILLFIFPYEALRLSFGTFDVLGTSITIIDILLALIFIIASITDFLDGYLARKNNLVTSFGKFADPIADKLLVNTAIILLAYVGKIHIIIPIIMIGRDTIVDAIRMMAANNNIVLAASIWGKAKTMTQMIATAFLLLNNIVFAYTGLPVDVILMWVATGFSILSGVDYFMKNKQFLLESM